jgi:predicted RecA/RadA family phage recombinase
MKNFIQEGDRITSTAPYALVAGAGCKIGQIFGVAMNDAANATEVVLKMNGVFDLVKIGSQAWAAGALVYWDDAAKRCTTVATTNLLIGACVRAVGAGAGEVVGRVLLNGAFKTQEV